MPNPIDLPRLEALHAEATRFYASGRIELTHDDETARRWAVVAFEAFPALLADLTELREKVQMTVDYNTALRAEREHLKARLKEAESWAQRDDSLASYAFQQYGDDARLYNGVHALEAENGKLRARVAELETERDGLAFELGKYSRVADNPALYQTINDCLRTDSLAAERDRLCAERDAANGTIAGLREAAKAVEVLVSGGYFVPHETLSELRAALARTSDQHRARIVAGRKRAVAEWIENEVRSGDQYYERSREGMLLEAQELRAEAERLEKGAGNEAKAV